MKAKEFYEMWQSMCAFERALMNIKETEYATDPDRLANLKQIAALEGRQPAQVAMTYLLKHILSINLALQKGRMVPEYAGRGGEGGGQRISDARNLLALLRACLIDQRKEAARASSPDSLGSVPGEPNPTFAGNSTTPISTGFWGGESNRTDPINTPRPTLWDFLPPRDTGSTGPGGGSPQPPGRSTGGSGQSGV